MASKVYYKATRLDGTDFYSGTIDYAGALESGKPLKRLSNPYGRYKCCSNTVYHAADTPSETLIGGSWPCRLFEVTGRPVDRTGHKFGFRSLRIVREIDAWLAFGPNGQEVAAFIERIKTLSMEDFQRLNAVWEDVESSCPNSALSGAFGAARVLADGAGRLAARSAALDAAYEAACEAAWHSDGYAAGYAGYAAGYATSALLLKDLINSEQFDILYGPWRQAIDNV